MEQDAHRVIVRTPSLPQTEGWSLWGGKRGLARRLHDPRAGATAVRVLSKSGRVQMTAHRGPRAHGVGSGRCRRRRRHRRVSIVSRSGSVAIERVTATSRRKRGADASRCADRRQGELSVAQRRHGYPRHHRRSRRAGAHGLRRHRERARPHLRARAHRQDPLSRRDRSRHRHEGADRRDRALGRSGQPFFIDAESQVGTVRSDLPPRRGGAGPSDGSGPKVRLRTGAGAIRLTRM